MVFFVVYNGVGYALRSRRSPNVVAGRRKALSASKSVKEFSGMIGQLGINQTILHSKGFGQRLDLMLLHAGYPFGWRSEDLLVYKEAAIVVTLFLNWQLGATDPFVWLLTTAGSFWAPDLFLMVRGAARKTAMERAIPGFVDLLALIIESGIDLLMAIDRIVEKMKPSPLREELVVLLQESRLGTSRKSILERWAARTNVADAQSLSSLIVQSEQMGTPLAMMLRTYAEDMRVRRALRAEELAGKIPVKILFPMIVFFFPIVFIIILGPVALDIMRNQ
jgi:tight adherence protein C